MIAAADARRGDFVAAAGLMVAALLLGGGSANSPVQRMIVEMVGVLVLGWFAVRGWRAPGDRRTWAALALIALTAALMVAQLVPLPPGVWQALPGRQIIVDVLAAVGRTDTWMPFSLDPAGTRESALFLLAPIAMFVATLHLDRSAQMKLVALVAAAAVISALLVMLQAQGMTWLTIYDAPHATKGKGIFANKNHNAALLVLAIPLVAVLGRQPGLLRRIGSPLLVSGMAILFLTLAVFGALSRAGLALLPLALLACVPLMGGFNAVKRFWKAIVPAAAALVIGAVIVARSAVVKETLDRFDASQEGRYVFWPDVIYAIKQFMPWGSGAGTFVPVFRINESLEAVHPTYTNHAHSDYLEIALEAGVPGLLLVAAFFLWFALTSWSRLRGSLGTPAFGPLLAAATGIAVLLAASAVDYPLRTLLLACVFSMLAAMLASTAPFSTNQAK
ncbi:O-antigen ligase family protein [Sphingomonas sp. CCH5-D11]|uniref:O-antigen ligase family protein n=1 Tax=Sphingomonas sp. CCH5-D11 TaxID=1768786 RepID=UPI00082BED99|nr:O-antigen ligase family protein [Sphingomonas sp. CCH5-D11]